MALDGAVALVTGASKGIGQAIAVALAAAGADVGVNYHTDRAGAKATCEAVAATGREGLPLHADVSDPVAVAQMFGELQAHFGRLDILVNNAAIGSRHAGSFADYPFSAWQQVFAVNLDGVVHCTQAALQIMLAQETGGRIVNISSSHSLVFQRHTTPYTVAKGALNTLTPSLSGRVRAAGDYRQLHCRRCGCNPGVAGFSAGQRCMDTPRTPRPHG